jgi:hypothetical protein
VPANRESLLAGRNAQPLEDNDIRRAYNTFLGLDSSVPVRHVPGGRTCFRLIDDGNGGETVEITFGEDLYPGASVADPNSSLSMLAAAAHEVTHFHRWSDKTELAAEALGEIDEALTSLQAILRFPKQLSDHDVRQLVADAIQRLQMFTHKNGE